MMLNKPDFPLEVMISYDANVWQVSMQIGSLNKISPLAGLHCVCVTYSVKSEWSICKHIKY